MCPLGLGTGRSQARAVYGVVSVSGINPTFMKTYIIILISIFTVGCAAHDAREISVTSTASETSAFETGEYAVIAEADPVGVDAYLPNISERVYKGMPKSEVIRLFRRYPDYHSDDGRTIGWMYNLNDGQKIFSLRLSFDEFDRTLGLGNEGLEVCVFKGHE